MKKVVLMTVCAGMILSSCGSYTGSGMYVGASLGSILGSAIGGISDGPRGSDIGTVVGMVGGAVVGGAIGAKADQDRQNDMDQYKRDKAQRAEARRQQQNTTQESGEAEGSGFDESNGGDDRIYDFSSSDYNGNYSAQQPVTTTPDKSSVDDIAENLEYTPNLEIRNARFVDDNQDGIINAGEVSKVIFEIYNRGGWPVHDVVPTVIETTGNRHLWVSPSIHVETIAPGKGIRYTAMVKADNSLKRGQAQFCVSVVQGNKAISKVSEFNIPTSK